MDNSLLAVRDINHKYIVVESRRQYTKDKVNEYFEILMRKIFIQYIEDEFDVTISFLYCLFRI